MIIWKLSSYCPGYNKYYLALNINMEVQIFKRAKLYQIKKTERKCKTTSNIKHSDKIPRLQKKGK